jgi:hypothetical protein
MQIDKSDEQPAKADSPIDRSLEPDSKVISESDAQRTKHCKHSSSMEEGMQIDRSDEQSANAPSSIQVS